MQCSFVIFEGHDDVVMYLNKPWKGAIPLAQGAALGHLKENMLEGYNLICKWKNNIYDDY